MENTPTVVKNTCVDVSYLVLGSLENQVYIISDGKGTMVVDPADDAPAIIEALNGKPLDAIFITHFHDDHTGALPDLKEATGARVYASTLEANLISETCDAFTEDCTVTDTLTDGDILKVGDMEWKIIATPGHSEGSLCAFLDPQYGNRPAMEPVLISGDTLFKGAVGRTDFPEGSDSDMSNSLRALSRLPENTVVLPGHGEITTIGDERFPLFRHVIKGH